MERVSTIGLDIAKHVFQVQGVDAEGAVVVRRKLRRDDVAHSLHLGSVANFRRGTETAERQELHAATMISNCSAIDGFGLQAYLACRLRIMWIISIPAGPLH